MSSTKTVTFLQINDTHGYLEPHPELFWQGGHAEYREAGGYARIASIFDEARRGGSAAVFAFDNGDTFHGTFHAVESRGEAFIEPVNLLGLDAWTVHWDFAYGVERLAEIAARLNHPLLACNCYHKDSGELAYPARTVLERGGVRVGGHRHRRDDHRQDDAGQLQRGAALYLGQRRAARPHPRAA